MQAVDLKVAVCASYEINAGLPLVGENVRDFHFTKEVSLAAMRNVHK